MSVTGATIQSKFMKADDMLHIFHYDPQNIEFDNLSCSKAVRRE